MLRFLPRVIVLIALCLLGVQNFCHALQNSIHYVENQGQFPADRQFVGEFSEGNVSLKTSAIQFFVMDAKTWHDNQMLEHPDTTTCAAHAFTMHFLDANTVEPVALDTVYTKYHYYMGVDSTQWRSNVPASSKVLYPNLYEGIDLLVYSLNGNFKYDFKVHPGADPSVIAWKYSGVAPMLNPEGELEFKTSWKTYKEKAPVAYQLVDNKYLPVDISFRQNDDFFQFVYQKYNPEQLLTIDPEIEFVTLSHIVFQLAALYEENIGGFLADTHGGSYPVSNGALNIGSANSAAGITKISSDGQQLEWNAAITGELQYGRTTDMAIHNGELYLFFYSAGGSFPTTIGVYEDDIVDPKIAISCLSLDGTTLIRSTTFDLHASSMNADVFGFNPINQDGSRMRYLSHVFVDNNIIFTYRDRQFSHQQNENGLYEITDDEIYHTPLLLSGGSAELNYSIAVASLTDDLTTLNYLHLINSDPEQEENVFYEFDGYHANDDYVSDIISLNNGNVALCGYTRLASFPTTEDTFQPQWGEDITDTLAQDGWIMVMNPENGDILHSTYLGGSGPDDVISLHEGQNGDIVAYGRTLSPELLTTPNAIDTGSAYLFVARIEPDLSQINHLARFGNLDGSIQNILPMSLGVDECDRVLVAAQQMDLYPIELITSFPVTTQSNYNTGSNFIGLLSKNLNQFEEAFLYPSDHAHSTKNKNYANGLYFHASCNDDVSLDTMQYDYAAVHGEFDLNDPGFGNMSTLFKFDVEEVRAGFNYELLNNCPNTEVAFIPDADDVEYTWGFPNQTLNSDSAGVIMQFDQAGTYPVQLIVSRESSCNKRDTATVLVEIPNMPEVFNQEETTITFNEIDPCLIPQTLVAQINSQPQNNVSWTLPNQQIIEYSDVAEFSADSSGILEVLLLLENEVCDTSLIVSEYIELFDDLIAEWEVEETPLNHCDGRQIQGTFTGNNQSSLKWFINGNLISDELAFDTTMPNTEHIDLILEAFSQNCQTQLELSVSFPATSAADNISVELPNVFTPNEDQYNNEFRLMSDAIFSDDFKTFNIQIFDRWGGLLFHADQPEFTWNATNLNGTPISEGVYFYTCAYELKCEESGTISKSGTVTVLR